MVRIRTSTEIVLSLLEFYRTAQPLLDTKPGSSARDVVIDGPSTQLARLYEELRDVSSLQSLRLSLGSDLDNISLNFGAVRQSGTKATGPALLTFNFLEADFAINKGDIITSKNGISFTVLNSTLISVVRDSYYKSIATRYLSDLDFVGITDIYAVEVLVEASSPGIEGNISKYSLNSTNINGINNVTNVFPFGGGANVESDAAFRNRVFAIFGGANTGTALGYKNAAKKDQSVIDAVVIEPGDTLMTRDGTEVYVNEDGSRVIISEGTGGKVDIIIYGTRLQETTSSYIYTDRSNTGDPTNSDNDFVLGQIEADEGKTVARKRLDNIKNKQLPEQPVGNVIEVKGSLSGLNFAEKSVDAWGRISGNYELVPDTGAYAGSPWSFDKIHWISNKISDFAEDITKGIFNGQDPLSYTDLIEVGKITQNISVTNENSTVSSSDRSSIQLAHYPISFVTRVFNVTTGERYVVSDQNPDSDDTLNPTGRIVITGQSLPSVSDVLQIDYVWVYEYDPYYDFDNRLTNNNARDVIDSVDWGFSSIVSRERVTLLASGSFLTATVFHPISSIISVNSYREESTTVRLSSNRLAVTVNHEVTSVISIVRDSDNIELWNTSADNGSFSNRVIFLPTDTDVQFGQAVTVVYNGTDVYNLDTSGSFSDNTISIAPSATAYAGRIVECTYIANVSTILPSTTISSLPAIRSDNYFNIINKSNIGIQPFTNVYDISGVIVSNIRQAPSNLILTISGSVSPGVITISGITMYRIADMVFTVSTSGLTHNLSSIVKSYLGLSSINSISSNIRLAKVVKFEKVSTSDDLVVLDTLHTFDIKGYLLHDNSFVKNECVSDSDLSLTSVTLPSTPNNLDNSLSVGDRVRVTCYIINTNDTENISFSKSGTLYTNKRFVLVDSIVRSSGFTSASSLSASLSISNMNQPPTRGRYKCYYDYIAPKPNERITIRYNYDKLVTDVTFAVESARPINADALVKTASSILIDVNMSIVVADEFLNSYEIVRQNVKDAITSKINVRALATILDQSDLTNAAYTVSGLDRARITYFNKSGVSGSTLSVIADKNQYLIANNVNVVIETR